jgi:hypothetical protein
MAFEHVHDWSLKILTLTLVFALSAYSILNEVEISETHGDVVPVFLISSVMINAGAVLSLVYTCTSNRIVAIVAGSLDVLGGFTYIMALLIVETGEVNVVGFTQDVYALNVYYALGLATFIGCKAMILGILLIDDKYAAAAKLMANSCVDLLTSVFMLVFWGGNHANPPPNVVQLVFLVIGWSCIACAAMVIIIYMSTAGRKQRSATGATAWGITVAVILSFGGTAVCGASICYQLKTEHQDLLQVTTVLSLGVSVLLSCIGTSIAVAKEMRDAVSPRHGGYERWETDPARDIDLDHQRVVVV